MNILNIKTADDSKYWIETDLGQAIHFWQYQIKDLSEEQSVLRLRHRLENQDQIKQDLIAWLEKNPKLNKEGLLWDCIVVCESLYQRFKTVEV